MDAITGLLTPIGAVGEVVIESPAISHGYINTTGVKAAAFLPLGLEPVHFKYTLIRKPSKGYNNIYVVLIRSIYKQF